MAGIFDENLFLTAPTEGPASRSACSWTPGCQSDGICDLDFALIGISGKHDISLDAADLNCEALKRLYPHTLLSLFPVGVHLYVFVSILLPLAGPFRRAPSASAAASTSASALSRFMIFHLFPQNPCHCSSHGCHNYDIDHTVLLYLLLVSYC